MEVSGDLNVDCEYCNKDAITLAGGIPLCADHYEESKPEDLDHGDFEVDE